MMIQETLDDHKSMMKGEYQDVIIHADGTREELPWQRNLIVNTIGNLISARFLVDALITGGLQYWAIGSGNPSWDTTPGSPNVLDTTLVNEFYRKSVIGAMGYIDGANAPSIPNTNRIQIVLTFSTLEANGDWREFGIFGGNATGAPNSGIMINHRVHGRITKTSAISIQRTLRLTF